MNPLIWFLLMAVWQFDGSTAFGPYYAHLCNMESATFFCPGDTVLSFSTAVSTQYPTPPVTCGTTTTINYPAACSTEALNPRLAAVVTNITHQCSSRKNCTVTHKIPESDKSECKNDSLVNMLRVVYSCLRLDGGNEVTVCSSMVDKPAVQTTHDLTCPPNQVISIDKIIVDKTPSSCSDVISMDNDLNGPCSLLLDSASAFYTKVLAKCSGSSTCTVSGEVVEVSTLFADSKCKNEDRKNRQLIYYSCVPDLIKKSTGCADDPKSGPALSCGTSRIQVISMVATVLYNGENGNCPYANVVHNFEQPGCKVDVTQEFKVYHDTATMCNDKTDCNAPVSAFPASPCGPFNMTTRNWFSISYKCSKTTAKSFSQVCTNQYLQLKCPKDQKLSVTSIYATCLFATGSAEDDYTCPAALLLGNSEIEACKLPLTSKGVGSNIYSLIINTCNGNGNCSVPINVSVTGPECRDLLDPTGRFKTYTDRNLYNVRYDCHQGGDGGGFVSPSDAAGSLPSSQSVGLGLGLTAMVIVIIAIITIVIYKRESIRRAISKFSGSGEKIGTGEYNSF